jgi:hypothetical protein
MLEEKEKKEEKKNGARRSERRSLPRGKTDSWLPLFGRLAIL